MPGTQLPVLPKRLLDFATLIVGASQDVIIGDKLELLHWRELVLLVRVHSHNMAGGNTIAISVFPQSWTPEDPAQQWIAQSTSATAVISGTTPNPGLLTLVVPTAVGAQPVGAMARVIAKGTKSGAFPMQAALTLEFAAKVA